MKLLVAISGGADSVALLLRMVHAGHDVVAAHCNFHLRGADSEADEAFVRSLCKRVGVELHVKQFQTRDYARGHGVSIEMAARELRYEWFEELRRQVGAKYVCVAHHADDNVETFLLNLSRGTGINGLTGMQEIQGNIYRPLLRCRREELRKWLRQRGETWREDASNNDTAFRRNKIRHELLPLLREMNPSVERAICDTMQRLATAERIISSEVAERLKQVMHVLPDGVALETEPLREDPLGEELIFRVLRDFGFPPAVADDVASHLDDEGGSRYDTATHICTRTLRRIEVRRRPTDVNPLVLKMGENILPDGGVLEMSVFEGTPDFSRRECAYLDAASIHGPLVYRSVRRGERFAPYGMRGSKLVSDYLADRNYSRIDRMQARVVSDKEGIVWIVADRVGARCAVTPATQRIILLERK